jgi:hypothetical protein
VCLEAIYASSYIGNPLSVNLKALEFVSILVSHIGFIIEAINSKALYDRYTKFLSIE